ncbi:MFS transporter [Celerinatantimonas sp. YJH-8]|uniref:MFS transporter n=1 Tax=Celerinatantimonas sp. YJH-8 TaxID=3228714 RepID=UPI0038C2638A
MKNVNKNMGFWASTLSLLMTFAASATPIPLYEIYRRSEGLSYNDLALTAVVYFVGAVTALLIFGRISNHLGRKPVIFLVFLLCIVADIILLNVNGAMPLILGRFLLGLACGLASSTMTAFIIDNAVSLPSWLPAAIVSNTPMVGLTLGAIASGAQVEYGAYPRIICYIVVMFGLVICGLLIAFSKETVRRAPGLLASLRPRFSMPKDRRVYPIAACTFVATWAVGGFFQAYGPTISAGALGSSSTLTGAIVFSSYMLPSALGGPLSARLTPAKAQRVGMVLFVLFLIGVLASIKSSTISYFLIASVLAGIAQGIVLTGSVGSLLVGVSTKERTGVLSLIYATSYTGAAVPNFIAGQMSHYMDLFHVALGYGFLAIFACVIVLIFAREPRVAKMDQNAPAVEG